MTKQQIIESAKRLPRDQQIDLALELWDIVEIGDDEFPLTDAQKLELDRRIADADAHQQNGEGEDWQALKAKLLRGEV